MVVRSVDVNNDPFRPQEKDEKILKSEVSYLSAIGELMYLANTTRPDITFSVNLLARYIFVSTKRHWNGIKHILRYLKGTIYMGLFTMAIVVQILLAMLMHDICPIHIKLDLKHVMYSHVGVLLYLGDL